MKYLRSIFIVLTLTSCGGGDLKDPPKPANMPAPDCAPQNCAGLRIIDGNAEAYRVDAMKKAG